MNYGVPVYPVKINPTSNGMMTINIFNWSWGVADILRFREPCVESFLSISTSDFIIVTLCRKRELTLQTPQKARLIIFCVIIASM